MRDRSERTTTPNAREDACMPHNAVNAPFQAVHLRPTQHAPGTVSGRRPLTLPQDVEEGGGRIHAHTQHRGGQREAGKGLLCNVQGRGRGG